MQLIALEDVTSAVRIIRSVDRMPTEVLRQWIDTVDKLLPEEVRDDQIEYTIASASKQEPQSEDYYKESLALARLYQKQAEEQHYNSINKALNQQLELCENGLLRSAEVLMKSWLYHLKQHQHKRTIGIKPNLFPLLVDQMLRWIILGTLGPTGQTFEAWEEGETLFYFTLAQFIIIPILTLALSFFQNRRNVKRNKQLIDERGLSKTVVLKKIGNQSYFFLLIFLLLLGVGVMYFIDKEDYEWVEHLISGITWLVYLALYHSWNTGALTEKSLGEQLSNSFDFSKTVNSENNDEVIVHMMEKLRSITSRLEAYVLESALFGALAFSGFLQIMAEGLVTFEDLAAFSESISALFEGIVYFDGSKIDFQFLDKTSALFSLIAMETLICSLLFLGVIASRLRFSNIADRIKLLTEVAKSYNQKEELLLHAKENQSDEERLSVLNQKIHDQLSEASKVLDQIFPITDFMKFFRSGGIVTFLIVLITSALLISPVLSIVFLGLSIGTLIYFNSNYLLVQLHTLRYKAQYFMLNYHAYVLAMSGILIVVSTYLSIYHQYSGSEWILMIAFILLLAYRMSMIILLQAVDQNFAHKGTISLLVRLFWAFGELTMWIGIGSFFTTYFDALTIPFIPFGILTLTPVFVVLSWKLTDQWPMRILAVLGLGLSVLGLMTNWDISLFTKILITSSFSCLAALTVIIAFRRNKLHKLLRGLVLGMFVALLYCQFILGIHDISFNLQTSNFQEVVEIEEGWYNNGWESTEDLDRWISVANLLQGYTTETAKEFKVRFARHGMRELQFRIDPVRKRDDDIQLERTYFDKLKIISLTFDPDLLENSDFKEFEKLEEAYFNTDTLKQNSGVIPAEIE